MKNKKLEVQLRFSSIYNLISSFKDNAETIYDALIDTDFNIDDEVVEELIKKIKYDIETLERYL